MTKEDKEDIIITATILRFRWNTRDPFKIAKAQKIEIKYCNVNTSIMKGCSYYSKTKKEIKINENLDSAKQKIICAHELGHIILEHTGKAYYKDNDLEKEYCANLFAVTLLFNDLDFNCRLEEMSNYTLQLILDIN